MQSRGWARVADEKRTEVFVGAAFRGDLVKGVGIEVGCEGFGSVEKKRGHMDRRQR